MDFWNGLCHDSLIYNKGDDVSLPFNAHVKTLTFMLAALFISCVSLSAYAEEMSTLYNIPERYALLVVTGADPAGSA